MKNQLVGLLILLCIWGAAPLLAQVQDQDTEAEPAAPEALPAAGLTDAADLETFIDGIMRIHMESRHIAGAVFNAFSERLGAYDYYYRHYGQDSGHEGRRNERKGALSRVRVTLALRSKGSGQGRRNAG